MPIPNMIQKSITRKLPSTSASIAPGFFFHSYPMLLKYKHECFTAIPIKTILFKSIRATMVRMDFTIFYIGIGLIQLTDL